MTNDDPQLIKIVLADDHAVVREGTRVLLDREDDFSVVGEAGRSCDCQAHASGASWMSCVCGVANKGNAWRPECGRDVARKPINRSLSLNEAQAA